jgi:hypothetical protein
MQSIDFTRVSEFLLRRSLRALFSGQDTAVARRRVLIAPAGS